MLLHTVIHYTVFCRLYSCCVTVLACVYSSVLYLVFRCCIACPIAPAKKSKIPTFRMFHTLSAPGTQKLSPCKKVKTSPLGPTLLLIPIDSQKVPGFLMHLSSALYSIHVLFQGHHITYLEGHSAVVDYYYYYHFDSMICCFGVKRTCYFFHRVHNYKAVNPQICRTV
jgi:hypothetical protein